MCLDLPGHGRSAGACGARFYKRGARTFARMAKKWLQQEYDVLVKLGRVAMAKHQLGFDIYVPAKVRQHMAYILKQLAADGIIGLDEWDALSIDAVLKRRKKGRVVEQLMLSDPARSVAGALLDGSWSERAALRALHPLLTEFAKLADYAFGDPLLRGMQLQEMVLEDARRKMHQKEASMSLKQLIDMPKTREVTSWVEVVTYLLDAQSKAPSKGTGRKPIKAVVVKKPAGSATRTQKTNMKRKK